MVYMNNLNSVILEGNIISRKETQLEGVSKFEFTIASYRTTKDVNGKQIEVITEVPCVAYGSIADSVKKRSTLGRGIRVVGRLSGSEGQLSLTVEHAEYKA
jgi:single-stranded DNA-binding protein